MTIRHHRPLMLLVVAGCVLAGCTQPGSAPDTTGQPATTSSQPAAAGTTTTRAPAQTKEQAILAAYDRSWDVYADAMRRLDPSRLPTAFAGPALEAGRRDVARQKAKNEPVLIDVTHHPKVVLLRGDQAIVEDNYDDRSVTLDPGGREPSTSLPARRVYQRQTLTLTDGVWKVTVITQERRSS